MNRGQLAILIREFDAAASPCARTAVASSPASFSSRSSQ
jgi:hypothetical protein